MRNSLFAEQGEEYLQAITVQIVDKLGHPFGKADEN